MTTLYTIIGVMIIIIGFMGALNGAVHGKGSLILTGALGCALGVVGLLSVFGVIG